MSKCPYCEQLSPAASKFCSECGAALHLQPCPQCGALNDIGKTTQCGRCEAPLLPPPELASEDTTEDKPATAPLPGADDRHSQHEPPLALALPLGLGGAARDGQAPTRRLLPALGLLLLGLMAMGAFYGSRPLQAQPDASRPQAQAAAPSQAQAQAQTPAEVQTPAPIPASAPVPAPVPATAPADSASPAPPPSEPAPRSRRVRASENTPQPPSAPSAPSPAMPPPARPAPMPPCSEAMAALNLCENAPSAAMPRKP